ncbi:MAG: hypothetical protein KDD58_07620 [Bdellovibrionales bacterium]|nr:hypothetical protein [Bdellovibrionales bacterium]
MKKNVGYSLVGVLIALSISSIIIFSITELLLTQNKQINHLNSKYHIIDLENLIRLALQDSQVCTNNFKNLNLVTINNSNNLTLSSFIFPPSSSINSIVNSPIGNSPKVIELGGIKQIPNITVESIKLLNWRFISSDRFLADIFIYLKSRLGPLAPIKILGLNVETDPASPINAKTLDNCNLGPKTENSSLMSILGAPMFPEHVICNNGSGNITFHAGMVNTALNEVYYRAIYVTGASHNVIYHFEAPMTPGLKKSSQGAGNNCPLNLVLDGRITDGP